MGKTEAFEKVRSIGQQQILQYYDTLDPQKQQELIAQIESLNIPTFREQQQLLLSHGVHKLRGIEPFHSFNRSGNPEDYRIGRELIRSGKVGCLIVAGGQGTRLGFDGPKGIYPISVIHKKSLFQLAAEKIAAASRQAGRPLLAAIMTSPLNHFQTIDFFKKHDFFGLQQEQITFFIQEMLPMLTPDGDLFLEELCKIAMGPDGNGSSLPHFYENGIWENWYEEGIRILNFILIDNPLADPFDAELAGFHHRFGGEVVIKCTTREDPKEKVGVIIKHEDKVKVVEYSELPEKERGAHNEEGALKHPCANISLFSFQMDFIQHISKTQLPLHPAQKLVRGLNTKASNVWKFERFVFDALPLAWKVEALLYPRNECFAPLKNSHGDSSPDTVRDALLARDRMIYSQITGTPPPSTPFELSQEFYYPTVELKTKWKNKKMPSSSYIEP